MAVRVEDVSTRVTPPAWPADSPASAVGGRRRMIKLYVVVIKPIMDRALALLMLIVTLPLLIVAAAIVLISVGRPVLFLQERVGRGGATFRVIKFRTMRLDRRRETSKVHVDVERRGYHKSDVDPRHTPGGRFLRKWSLDELPQLINVVKGDMSLVGPRPELPKIVEKYEHWQHERHVVRPGLTGLWQINARGDGPMHLRTDLDVEYIRSLGVATDCRILLKTVPALMSGRKGS
jgi:lipopolysaccharide/colanic/teichoic acid biosynthesis glycosyltransferase